MTATPDSTATGRQVNGRFAKGNKFGPGNPFARQVAGLRSALLRKMDETHMEKIADLLLAQALEGDLAAIKLVLLYAIGRPAECVNPDDLDRLEFEQHQDNMAPFAQISELLKGRMPVEVANECLRTALPCIGETIAQGAAETLRTGKVPQPADTDDDPTEDPSREEPAASPPPAKSMPKKQPAPTAKAQVLPFVADTVTTREQRSDRAANGGQSKPVAPPRPDGRGSGTDSKRG